MKNTGCFFFIGFFIYTFSNATVVTGGREKNPAKPVPTVKNNQSNQKAADVSNAKAVDKSKNFWNQETASSVFIVQNIATEKTRVYKRCVQSIGCAHELLFETDTLVGQATSNQKDSKVFATRLGHFKIAKWVKFFEDKNKKFPAWYKSNYSVVPKGTPIKEWISQNHLPEPQVNKYRGAYGWMTALLGPNSDEQVIHGTYGWSVNQNDAISYFRSMFVSFIDDPMASGATRLENQAVAYLRHLAEVGSDVLRVYAIEAYADAELARYQQFREQRPVWDWVLTTQDAQKDSVSLDRGIQVRKNYVYSDVLEEGQFLIDRYPTGLGYSSTLFGLGASNGTTGNTYQIKRKQFKGVFLVDEGRFVDYEHPQNEMLTVSGYPKHVLPAYVESKNSSFSVIQPDVSR